MADDELTITFTGEPARSIRFAARTFGVDPGEVVIRAIRAMQIFDAGSIRPRRDPWEPVPIVAEYDDTRVEGLFLPATARVTVTTGPVTGQHFKSPSGAARTVVAALNPARAAATTNGWKFWRLTETGERLEVLRPR